MVSSNKLRLVDRFYKKHFNKDIDMSESKFLFSSIAYDVATMQVVDTVIIPTLQCLQNNQHRVILQQLTTFSRWPS